MRVEETSLIDQLDAWCKKRAENISGRAGDHIRSGRSLNEPDYRVLMGEHRAYLAMRSYLHGSLRSKAKGAE